MLKAIDYQWRALSTLPRGLSPDRARIEGGFVKMAMTLEDQSPEGHESAASPSASPYRGALSHIVNLYEAWGKPEKAAEWRGKRADMAEEAEQP